MNSTADSVLLSRRTEIEAAMVSEPLDPSVTLTRVREPGFEGILIDSDNYTQTTTLIHMHGGGFRLGSAAAWAPFLSHVAAHTKTRVLDVDYPLAPECPFPAALEACRSAAEWVADTTGGFVLSGDSAGAGLAAAAALSLGGVARSCHQATILLSPWIDLRVVNGSFDECGGTDTLFSAEDARDAAASYCPGGDLTDPLLSPGLGDWTGQPPVLIETSSSEVLRDDARNLAAQLMASGVTVWFREVVDQPHDWHITGPSTEVVQTSLGVMREFISMTSAPPVQA